MEIKTDPARLATGGAKGEHGCSRTITKYEITAAIATPEFSAPITRQIRHLIARFAIAFNHARLLAPIAFHSEVRR